MKISELLHDIGRPVAYSPKLAVLIGVKECVLLSQLIYWSDKAEDGWIYKSVQELEMETGLSYHEQRSTRKTLLDAKLIKVRNDRKTHRLYFQVCKEELDAIWDEKRSLRPVRDTQKASSERWEAPASDGDATTCVGRNRSPASDGDGHLRPTHSDYIGTETTGTETTNKGATSAPGFNDFVRRWVDEFQECFREPYDVSMMGKDGKHLSRFLKFQTKRSPEELIKVARQAWERHAEFGFGMSVTITGFCTNFNTIVAKLATSGKGNPEGSNLREHLSSKIL